MATRKDAAAAVEAGPDVGDHGGGVVSLLPGAQRARQQLFVVVRGAGNSGKTTLLRYLAEQALSEQRPVVIADGDRSKPPGLHVFFGEGAVERPPAPDDGSPPDDDSTMDWLGELVTGQEAEIAAALEADREGPLPPPPASILLEMAGSDLLFPAWATRLDLMATLREIGIEPGLLCTFGPGLDDLAALAELMKPGCYLPGGGRTVLVRNAGTIAGTRHPDMAFAALRAHPTYRRAIEEFGAREVLMPMLPGLAEIDRMGLLFSEAASGRLRASPPVALDADGQARPLPWPPDGWSRWGTIHRAALRVALARMKAAFAPCAGVLP